MSSAAKIEAPKADYTYWRNALAGTFGPVHDSDPQLGFYRKRIKRAGAYVPVAIWEQDTKIIALVDGQQADAAEIWSFVCQYPISEEHYHARVKTGKWHDEDDAVTESLAHRTDTNNPPTDEAELLQEQIDAATAGAGNYAEITDDETAAKAQALRSRLLELSGNADRLREDKKRPHLEAGKAIDTKFMPLVKAAKNAADAIRAALGAHETRKAREAEKIRRAEEEMRLQAEQEAAAARAEAEKAGAPAPVEPEPAPPPPAPAPVPETATSIRGAYGRAAAVKVVKVAKVVDQDKAYMAMRTHKELVELIAKLAQRAATAGVSVDGVEVTEERTVA